MVVGQREESIEAKNQRHIKEMKADIEGWENELDYAIKKNDTKYANYCKYMRSICLNTLAELENIQI